MADTSNEYRRFQSPRRSTFWNTLQLGIVVGYLPILLILQQGAEVDDNFVPLVMTVGSTVILLWAWSHAPKAATAVLKTRPLRWLLFYLCYVAIVTVVSETFIAKTGWDKLRELLMLGVYISPGVAAAILIQRPGSLELMLRGVRALGWLILGTFLYGLTFSVSNEASSISRVFGVYGDSVAWSASFFLILSLSYGRWLEFGAFVTMIALSGSMGAAIAGTVGIVVHTMLLVARKRLSFFYVLAPILFVLVAVQFVDLSNVPVVQRLFSEDQKAFSLNARVGSFAAAMDIVRDHPLLGVGFSGYFEAALQYDVERYFDVGFSYNYIANAQNQYLQVLTEGGVPGLILFIIVMYSALTRLFRQEEVEQPDVRPFMSAAFAWLASLCIANQTAVWLMPHSLNTVIFALIIGAVSARRRAFWGRRGGP